MYVDYPEPEKQLIIVRNMKMKAKCVGNNNLYFYTDSGLREQDQEPEYVDSKPIKFGNFDTICICIGLYWFVIVCIGVIWFALVYSYWYLFLKN
jgi:hypothetical protein